MKIDRHGRAKILTPEEIKALFSPEYYNARDRALYAVMLYTACRVREAVTLRKLDIYDLKGEVRPEILFRKGNTKGKLATRSVPVIDDLRRKLEDYQPRKNNPYLFPGNEHSPRKDSYLHSDSACLVLLLSLKHKFALSDKLTVFTRRRSWVFTSGENRFYLLHRLPSFISDGNKVLL